MIDKTLATITLCALLHWSQCFTLCKASELDQYLVQQKILSADYKIQNIVALNEILDIISDEDSRTMPYQVDQKTQLNLIRRQTNKSMTSDMIVSPDFTQFVESTGYNNVKYD